MKLTLTLAALLALCCALQAQAANLTQGDIAQRACYVQEVRHIAVIVGELRQEGLPEQSVAEAAHGLRRDIGREYKSLTSREMLAQIHHRNRVKYGDPLGPSLSYLRAKGKSWREIANQASQTGGRDILPAGLRLPCLEGWR